MSPNTGGKPDVGDRLAQTGARERIPMSWETNSKLELVKNEQPSEQPPNDFGLSVPERPIHFNLFIFLVPGGGVVLQPPIDGM